MLAAIIVAAGSSQRMGFDKLFASVAGRPVISHTLAAFGAAQCVSEIILVARGDRLAEFEKTVQEARLTTPVQVVAGGLHRQESVRAGLEKVRPEIEYVAVHDAARPLVTAETIEELFQLCLVHQAVALAVPVADTLKRVGEGHIVLESVDRRGLYAMQTPQVFSRRLLEAAYHHVFEHKLVITDEVSAVEKLGQKVRILPGKEANLKLTCPDDLAVVESLLVQRDRL